MGRPPIGKKAMTTAERQRRHWERVLGASKPAPKSAADAMEFDALKRDLAQAKAKISELEKQLALARMARGKTPESVEEMVAMRRVADEVRSAERAAARARRHAEAAPPEPGETMESLAEKLRSKDRQLKAAQTRIRNLQVERIALAQRKTIPMSPDLVRTLRAAIHPDRAPTDPKKRARLEEYSKEFNNYKFVSP
jgi:hypothetical protein